MLRLVFSSTCATYGEPEEVPISEQCRQWPKNPYGWTKLLIERLLDSYDTAYQLKFVALRYFNAAGATKKRGEDHEPEPHLIPNVLATALGEQPSVPVFGNNYPTADGTPIRDYIHVTDLAEAHVRALEYLRRGGASNFLNLGTGSGFSVLEVVECAREVTGREIATRLEPPRARRSFAADCECEQGAAGAGLGAGGLRSADDHSHGVGMAAAASPRVHEVTNEVTQRRANRAHRDSHANRDNRICGGGGDFAGHGSRPEAAP